jgi:hypothetical protein
MNDTVHSLRFGLAAPLWLLVANTSTSTTVRIIAEITAIVCALSELIPVIQRHQQRRRFKKGDFDW